MVSGMLQSGFPTSSANVFRGSCAGSACLCGGCAKNTRFGSQPKGSSSPLTRDTTQLLTEGGPDAFMRLQTQHQPAKIKNTNAFFIKAEQKGIPLQDSLRGMHALATQLPRELGQKVGGAYKQAIASALEAGFKPNDILANIAQMAQNAALQSGDPVPQIPTSLKGVKDDIEFTKLLGLGTLGVVAEGLDEVNAFKPEDSINPNRR